MRNILPNILPNIVAGAAAGLAALGLAGSALADDFDNVAEIPDDARWAFTREISTGGGRVVARFDPSRAEDDRWVLLEPADPAQLTNEQEGLFNSMLGEPHADLALRFKPTPDDEDQEQEFGLDTVLEARGRLLRSEGANDVYSVDPSVFQDDDNADFIDKLSGELTLDRASGEVRSFRMYADRSFKPHPLARVRSFDMTMTIGELIAGGPQGLLGIHLELYGSAMFQDFGENMFTTNSDFAPVP